MICENCGRPLENNNTVIDTKEDGVLHIFCRECGTLFGTLFGTCAMCAHTYCGFFNDPDPMPQFKIAMHQTKQGNATFIEQKQVPNPDRVKSFAQMENVNAFLMIPSIRSAVVMVDIQLAQIIARKKSITLFKIFYARSK